MSYTEYVEQLISGYIPPAPSPILQASEALSIHYLRHIMVVHKYTQEYREDSPQKKVEILIITRVLDGFVTSAHHLRGRFYNSAIAELRSVYDSLNLMRWLLASPEAFEVYLSSDTARVLREFTPSRVRSSLVRTPYDTIYSFLASYATHPFFTGKEYLLGLDVNEEPASLHDRDKRHYDVLDGVAAAVQLMTFAYATYECGTNFERTPLVDQDRSVLREMYSEIDQFLRACEPVMGQHRSIHNVSADFREQFPSLLDATRTKQQQAT